MAGNQLGKSEAGSAEVAAHATGRYPVWWEGHRFDKPLRIWVSGVTALTTRDIIQRKLLGPPGQVGTGWIPPDCIVKLTPSRGIPDAYDFATIRHSSGGLSYIFFKSYEQGREKFQGDSIDFLWLDEEPPMAIWSESVARLTATKGLSLMTFTPLKGLSEVVRGFYPSPDSGEKAVVQMEMRDARHEDGTGHISDEEMAAIEKRYPSTERDARVKGIPVLGSGLIYLSEIKEHQLVEPPQEPQPFWRRIVGLDLGGADHSTAFCVLAHDADVDVVHIQHTYKHVDARIAVHAAAINSTAQGIPVAWPKDAHVRDRNDGMKFADIYRKHGTMMLREHAQWKDGTVSVNAGIAEIFNRMAEGRLKVPYSCTHFWEEARLYHRIDGIVNKQFDDLMDSLRYGIMMLRFARRARERSMPTHAIRNYDPLNPVRRYERYN